MASTLLEQTREAHEECERLERFIVSDLKTEAITHKQRLRQGHRVNRALDAIAANAKRLRITYADADRARGGAGVVWDPREDVEGVSVVRGPDG